MSLELHYHMARKALTLEMGVTSAGHVDWVLDSIWRIGGQYKRVPQGVSHVEFAK